MSRDRFFHATHLLPRVVLTLGLTSALASCALLSPVRVPCDEGESCPEGYERDLQSEACACLRSTVVQPDAGGPDAGMADAGEPEPDAGIADAGEPAPDAGERDAGMADAGEPDAGEPAPDAGERDAGMADAGMPDTLSARITHDGAPEVGTVLTCESDDVIAADTVRITWSVGSVSSEGEVFTIPEPTAADAEVTCIFERLDSTGTVLARGTDTVVVQDTPPIVSVTVTVTDPATNVPIAVGRVGDKWRCDANIQDPNGDVYDPQYAWFRGTLDTHPGVQRGTGPAFTPQERGAHYCAVELEDDGPAHFSDQQTIAATEAQMVAAGGAHSCVQTVNGRVGCVGSNRAGQRGVSDFSLQLEPNYVLLPVASADLVAGAQHTCARTLAGEVWCWGKNDAGQLGRDTNGLPSPTPARVMRDSSTPLTDVTRLVSGANHVCAVVLDSNPGLYCWGANDRGQLGQQPSMGSWVPARVNLSSSISALAAGAAHTCAAVGANPALRCWGDNTHGQLGRPSSEAPDPMPAAPSFTITVGEGRMQLAAGAGHTCAVSDGALRCWGDNTFGQIGAAQAVSDTHMAVNVPSTEVFDHVVAGAAHTCVQGGENAYCMGRNDMAEAGGGTGDAVRALRRVQFPQPIGVAGVFLRGSLRAGSRHTCAIEAAPNPRVVQAQRMVCWGLRSDGRLWDGTNVAMKSGPVNSNPFDFEWAALP